MRLFTTPEEKDETMDTAFVDNFVDSDAVLYMILKKEGSESWEAMDVAPDAASSQ